LDYEEVRDRILVGVRAKHNLGKQAKSHQIAKQALDEFIAATAPEQPQ
jgi:hypothetical protein